MGRFANVDIYTSSFHERGTAILKILHHISWRVFTLDMNILKLVFTLHMWHTLAELLCLTLLCECQAFALLIRLKSNVFYSE